MAKWTKGQSGNPGGRPRGEGDIRELARKHTSSAVRTLAAIMNDASAAPSARVGAASALLDRGWGRPAQTINANLDANKPMVDERLLASMGDLLDKFVAEPENKRETGVAPIIDGPAQGDSPASSATH